MNSIERIKQINQENADKALSSGRHEQSLSQLQQVQDTIVQAAVIILEYLDGKTTKTEVLNQISSVSTPDFEHIVTAVDSLGAKIDENKLDLSPLKDDFKTLNDTLKSLPEKLPKPDKPLSEISVSNLKEMDTQSIVDAIEALDLHVEAPQVNVEKPELKPIQDTLLKVVKAVDDIEIPKPESPYTKKGKSVKVELEDGAIPTQQKNLLINEKFDEYKLVYDDFDEDNETIQAIHYFYKKKKVATLKYKYDNKGRLISGKRA
jgi:hypothetical protein